MTVGVVDGAIMAGSPCLGTATIETLGRPFGQFATDDESARHATSVATILVGTGCADSAAICPDVHLLNYPVFGMGRPVGAEDIAVAVAETVRAGARVVNLSVVVNRTTPAGDSMLSAALDEAAKADAIVVAATSNQPRSSGSMVTRHRAVLPVVAYLASGRPFPQSGIARSVGLRGVGAPGELNARSPRGTSVAAAVVTGAIALLRSEFPQVSANRLATVLRASVRHRNSVLPGLFNAWHTYHLLTAGGVDDHATQHQ